MFDNLKYELSQIKFKVEDKLDDVKTKAKEEIDYISTEIQCSSGFMKAEKVYGDTQDTIENLRGLIQTSDKKEILKRGVVLRISRKLVYHYGIYAGNDMVINWDGKEVVYNTLYEFCYPYAGLGHNKIEVMAFGEEYSSRYTLEESYLKAKSQVGIDGYHLFNNNCEQFALWCRIGENVSTQLFNRKSTRLTSMSFSSSLSNANACTDIISDIFAKKFNMKVSRIVNPFNIVDVKKS